MRVAQNVVLDAEGTVRLIDFGSAAYVKEGRKFDTFSGTLECVFFPIYPPVFDLLLS